MLKDEVVTLELSKKLKELGFPQKKSSLKWYGFYEIQCSSVERQEYTLQTANVEDACVIEIDAPLATEILREIPNKIFYNFETLAYGLVMSVSRDSLEDFIVGYYRVNMKETCIEIREEKLVDALAKMWIWLKENDLLTQRATDGEQ